LNQFIPFEEYDTFPLSKRATSMLNSGDQRTDVPVTFPFGLALCVQDVPFDEVLM